MLDPERLFDDPGYLMDVMIGDDLSAEERIANVLQLGLDSVPQPPARTWPRWRLLILEDCDELIRDEARQSAGQALSRLLNLTDGLVGQGRKVLIAITTNEELRRLHPAVTRPGRCLAQVEVVPFAPAEAGQWLGRHGPQQSGQPGAGAFLSVTSPVTLAELYALRSGRMPPCQRPASARSPPGSTSRRAVPLSGQYL